MNNLCFIQYFLILYYQQETRFCCKRKDSERPEAGRRAAAVDLRSRGKGSKDISPLPHSPSLRLQKGINAIQTVSYSLHQVESCIEKSESYEILRSLIGSEGTPQPKVIVNLLQGSKLVGVKCKVFKFLLIIERYTSGKELVDIATQITGNLRKAICAGKLGEAALKFHSDGTFIVVVDTIADNLKMIEEAISKTPYKDNVSLGINLMADNLYLADKKLYELENPKQLMDPLQMVTNTSWYRCCLQLTPPHRLTSS